MATPEVSLRRFEPGDAGAVHRWFNNERATKTLVAQRRSFTPAEAEDWVLYDLPPELLGRIWGGRFGGQRQKWVLMRFLGDDSQIDIATPQAEFSRWSWMRADDLIERIVPFKRGVYEHVFGIFRDRLIKFKAAHDIIVFNILVQVSMAALRVFRIFILQ